MKAIFLLLCLFTIETVAEATTFHAGSGGTGVNCTQYQSAGTRAPTIAAAVACLVAGDRLEIHAGTYGESISPMPSGNPGAHITIASFGSDTVNFNSLMDFRFNTPSGVSYLDFVGGCTSGANRACRMNWDGTGTSCGGAPLAEACIDGPVFGPSTHHITFNGARFHHWAGMGSNVSTDNITFSNGRQDHNGCFTAGLCSLPNFRTGYAWYSGGSFITIENYEIDNNKAYAMHQRSDTTNPSWNIYRNNIIHNNGGPWYMSGSGIGTQFYGNTIYDNNQEAIGIESCSPGADLSPAGQLACPANQPWKRTRDTLIYDNTIYLNGQGVGYPQIATGIGSPPPTGTIVRNNLFYKNNSAFGLQAFFDGGPDQGYPANDWVRDHNLCDSSEAGCDLSPILSTTNPPLFADEANRNFSLLAGSPAIDRGIVTICAACGPGGTAVTAPLFSGKLPDVGALESGESAPPPPQILAGQWSFDENAGTAPQDSSGNNNHGSFSSGVSYASGKYNYALSFNGTSAVTVPNSASLNVSTGFTLEAWVNPTSVSGDRIVMVKNPDSHIFLFASLSGYCGTNAVAGGYSEGSNTVIACYSTPLTTGIWTHLSVTYSTTTGVQLYVNAQPVTSASGSNILSATTGTFQIGGSGFGEFFNGLIDEPRFYSYALPQNAGGSACNNAPSILRDMNCPINTIVTPPSAVSGFTVSSTGGFTVGTGGSFRSGN